MLAKQIPLRFEFQSNQSFSTFYPGNNQEIINHLHQLPSNNEQLTFLWGDAGTGKTHLLQAVSQETNKQGKTSFHFSFNKNNLPSASMLDGLENIDLVCFDNIDQISGNAEWEHNFFNFYNVHRDNSKQLVLSSTCPPKFLAFQLTDLKTRMSWGLTFKINYLSDEQILKALIHKANYLGFEIPLKVGQFLMTHYARDLPSIWKILDKVEQETLAAKRKLTIPFLKQIMSDVVKNGSR